MKRDGRTEKGDKVMFVVATTSLRITNSTLSKLIDKVSYENYKELQ